MAHYKAADSKREQFRRYLEKSGVLDTLTKVLVALYEEPEKPNSALEYPFSSFCELISDICEAKDGSTVQGRYSFVSILYKLSEASYRSRSSRKSRSRGPSPGSGRDERKI
ncbi:C-Myc-binding protein isoform X1 [Chelonia mydas]|uniref:C-Myc-binding protein isoform X1 n=1 Tax=Chelonia mydas TaxID=8469 RepID=UPI0018A1FEA2|nr:C-Myc-binding protein isoform X1 [Chelonia mydas]